MMWYTESLSGKKYKGKSDVHFHVKIKSCFDLLLSFFKKSLIWWCMYFDDRFTLTAVIKLSCAVLKKWKKSSMKNVYIMVRGCTII